MLPPPSPQLEKLETPNPVPNQLPTPEEGAGKKLETLMPPKPANLSNELGDAEAKRTKSGQDADSDAKSTTSEMEEEWEEFLKNRVPILAHREVDFEHFKNRYGADDGRHIIEVLVASPTISDDIKIDERRRAGIRLHPLLAQETPVVAGENTWWQRIRINSLPVLGHLQNAANIQESWATTSPRTFFRPFNMLTYYLPKMEQVLRDLEDKWGEIERADSLGQVKPARVPKVNLVEEDKVQGVDRSEGQTAESMEPDATILNSNLGDINALRHMRVYVDFVNKKLLPLLDTFQGTSRTKVRFNDLNLLFKPGDLVYSLPFSQRNHRTAWRVYHSQRSRFKDEEPDDIELSGSDNVKLCCYCIDYNSSSYGLVKQKFTIDKYWGERSITDLPVYPIRYAKDAEKVRHDLKAQGEAFCSLVKVKHLYYEGWTIPGDIGDSDDDHLSSSGPEHIESAVILDFGEAFNHRKHWKPKIAHIEKHRGEFSGGEDRFQLCHWSNRARDELWCSTEEKIQLLDDVHMQMKDDYLELHDKFVSETKKHEITKLEREEDLILLPRRLIAYALRERRFVPVDVVSLRHLEKQKRIFRDLKIDPDHKLMVRSLVRAHFRNRDLQRHRPQIGLGQDIIRGKGSSLVILLHGAPGVGKTATAEAIAQSNNKPLFTITCGDLGSTPREVESELKEIFRLAHLWDCVLLLDEADIFLARRDMVNLKRNALVSVFLRVLEYYSGILFLTTNRVGLLDEAFKSRIHVSLYYERLNFDRTLAIFRVNIRKLKEIEKEKAKQLEDSDIKEPPLVIEEDKILDFAEEHFLDSPKPNRWNGRQIRNAFQVASSLARYDIRKSKMDDSDSNFRRTGTNLRRTGTGMLEGGENEKAHPILDDKQFRLVAKAVERFDTYIHLATGKTDEDAARIEGTRDDDVRNDELAPIPQPQDPFTLSTRPRRGEGGKSHSKESESDQDYQTSKDRRQGGQESEYDEEPYALGSSAKSAKRTNNSGRRMRKEAASSKLPTGSEYRQRSSQQAPSRQPHRRGNSATCGSDDDEDDDDYMRDEPATDRGFGKTNKRSQKTARQRYRHDARNENGDDDEEEDSDFDNY